MNHELESIKYACGCTISTGSNNEKKNNNNNKIKTGGKNEMEKESNKLLITI